MLEQVPTSPARLQAWQVPLQETLQQTLSTQKPLLHWEFKAQAMPWGLRQVPLWQVSPEPQTVPSALLGLEHIPVAGLQVPVSWHRSRALQETGLPPVHIPA